MRFLVEKQKTEELERPKLKGILDILFGINTANVVQLAGRIEQRAQLAIA